MTNFYNSMSDLQTFQRQYQDKYNAFLFKILQENACNGQCKYPSFEKGLLYAIKSFLNILGDINSIFVIEDANEFTRKLDSLIKLDDFDQFRVDLSIVIYNVSSFIQEMSFLLFENVQDGNLGFFVSQICLNVIVGYLFCLMWKKYIENQVYSCKQLLFLIDIDILLQNSYILAYFKIKN